MRRSDEATAERDVVLLVVPSDGAYLAVLRTATAGIAARLQYTLDEIEDLRIAVDEACAMLIPAAAPDSELSCEFEIAKDVLTVRVSVPTLGVATLPPAHSFAWRVLTTLADEVNSTTSADRASIELVSRGVSRPPR
ncbi:MAG: anti-sigma regulatory factor [Micromonosporaceae bacterium]